MRKITSNIYASTNVILFVCPLLLGCSAGSREENSTEHQELLNRVIGQIAYKVPDLMTVGEPSVFEARLTLDSATRIAEDFGKEGVITIDKLELTNRVRVRLVSIDDVAIEPVENEEQALRPNGFSTWTWHVTAQSSGIKQFTLKIGLANIDKLDPSLPSFVPGRDFKISVSANLPYTMNRFISNHWQWILGTFIIPLLAYFVNQATGDKNKIPVKAIPRLSHLKL